MKAYIQGKLIDVDDAGLIIEVGGSIGYEVPVTEFDRGFFANFIGEVIKVWVLEFKSIDPRTGKMTEAVVGFSNGDFRSLFRALTKVQGCGVKTAIGMFDGDPDDVTDAISSEDAKALTKFKGVGPAMAQAILKEFA